MNRLITIPISHYCEKARWALERGQVEYREERHLQFFHYPFSLSAGRSVHVPVLIAEGVVLTESSDIMKWANQRMPTTKSIYPALAPLRSEIEKFEHEMDQTLGPAGRLWMYTYLFKKMDLFIKYSGLHKVPDFELKLLPKMFPWIRPLARARLKMHDDSREKSKITVDRILDMVSIMLADGRPFLFGEQFSAADLTFAALCAPVVLPPNYGVALPGLDELPEPMSSQIQEWRQTPAGAFALKMFERHRNS